VNDSVQLWSSSDAVQRAGHACVIAQSTVIVMAVPWFDAVGRKIIARGDVVDQRATGGFATSPHRHPGQSRIQGRLNPRRLPRPRDSLVEISCDHRRDTRSELLSKRK